MSRKKKFLIGLTLGAVGSFAFMGVAFATGAVMTIAEAKAAGLMLIPVWCFVASVTVAGGAISFAY